VDRAELDRLLGDARRAFVDTSTCIAYHSVTELAHPAARHLLDRVANDADPLVAYISTVSVAEMLVRPIRAGASDLKLVAEFFRGFRNLEVIDVNLDVAIQAANIRAVARLALPDALLVGTAIMAGCEVIVTNDERWARRLAPLYPQFRWIYLGA
jgi:predicted nucleic acid-binding protein